MGGPTRASTGPTWVAWSAGPESPAGAGTAEAAGANRTSVSRRTAFSRASMAARRCCGGAFHCAYGSKAVTEGAVLMGGGPEGAEGSACRVGAGPGGGAGIRSRGLSLSPMRSATGSPMWTSGAPAGPARSPRPEGPWLPVATAQAAACGPGRAEGK